MREGRLSGRWARQGSNLHGLLHRILSPARLPIPPRAHKQRGEPTAKGGCGESFNWGGRGGSMGHEPNLRHPGERADHRELDEQWLSAAFSDREKRAIQDE